MNEKVRDQNRMLAPIERMGWLTTLVVFVGTAGYLYSEQKEEIHALKERVESLSLPDRVVSMEDIWQSPALVPPNGSSAGNSHWVKGQFFVMKTEVTQALFERVVQGNHSAHMAPKLFQQVSQALSFADRLSRLHGLEECYASVQQSDARCSGWRIPEAKEWRLFASAEQGTRFAGSDRFEDVGWPVGDPYLVAEKPPNRWGIYDMSGGYPELVYASPMKAFRLLGSESSLEMMEQSSVNQSFALRLVRKADAQSLR